MAFHMSTPRVGEVISHLKKRDQSVDLSVHSYKRSASRVWQFSSPSVGPYAVEVVVVPVVVEEVEDAR